MNVDAHAILYLACSFQLCDFDASFLYWCRKPKQQRISISHVTRRSGLEMPHAHKWDLVSLDWPVNPFGRCDPSRSSLPPDVPSGEQQRGAFPASTHSRWRQGALHTQLQIVHRPTGWDGCGSFLSEGLRCITWNTRRLVGSVFSRQRHTEFKLK